MINIVKPFFPPLNEYNSFLEKVWKNQWLTNRGPLLLELEDKIKHRFNLENGFFPCNGTLPIQLSLRALADKGEVITTPFSFIATASAIVWENCTPVFVDIDPEYLTIDESLIEEAITEKTKVILATHVFGNPCNVEVIDQIAKKHGLKVIYDAAHCFEVNYKGKSIFEYGDVSTCSFHATKLFQTGEGGAVFTKDKELYNELFYSHNFGFDGPENYHGVGINGKMSELNAALGLAVYPYINRIIESRKAAVEAYDRELNFTKITRLKLREGTEWNYCYYPLVFENEEILIKIMKILEENKVFTRRYFHPSLNTIEYMKGNSMPVSEKVSSCVLCLPLHFDVSIEDANKISKLINEQL